MRSNWLLHVLGYLQPLNTVCMPNSSRSEPNLLVCCSCSWSKRATTGPPAQPISAFSMLTATAVAEMWLQTRWLLWGVGPVLASNIGFFVVCTLLELLMRMPWFRDSAIVYNSSAGSKTRQQLTAATHLRIPFNKQLKGCIKTLAGPQCIINGTLMALLMTWAKPDITSWWPSSVAAGVLQFVALVVLADFGLYWGHRIQHEYPYLWKMHAKHHAIDTPTPFSTAFIHPIDAALQGSIPLALAAAAVRPEPAIMYLFIGARIAENGLNHSGLDSKLLDLVTLKSLPFRAPAAFHDAHHKYSNHAHNAKNYGESFWVWDWMFGTTSPLIGQAAWKMQQQEQGEAVKVQ